MSDQASEKSEIAELSSKITINAVAHEKRVSAIPGLGLDGCLPKAPDLGNRLWFDADEDKWALAQICQCKELNKNKSLIN